MPENENVNENVVEEKNTDAVPSEETDKADVEGAVADRPEINYQRELERKNAQIERLKQEAENNRNNSVQKRDQNDLSTWSDHELKAIKYSNDPSALPFRDQADEILLERKVNSIREKERMQEKRAMSELEMRKNYPEALDPNSELSLKMEQVLYEYDLQKSPAGRLAAAKIAASELGLGHSKSTAQARKAEADRVARVKGQMVDGDRAKSTDNVGSSKKLEEAIKKANSKNLNESAAGFNDVLKHAGISRENFFNGPGYSGRR